MRRYLNIDAIVTKRATTGDTQWHSEAGSASLRPGPQPRCVLLVPVHRYIITFAPQPCPEGHGHLRSLQFVERAGACDDGQFDQSGKYLLWFSRNSNSAVGGVTFFASSTLHKVATIGAGEGSRCPHTSKTYCVASASPGFAPVLRNKWPTAGHRPAMNLDSAAVTTPARALPASV